MLMERVVERSNLWLAYQRVVENKGAPGIDGMPVSELKDWLKVHWPSVKKALLEGPIYRSRYEEWTYPKPSGGVRTLGVPTVVDRLIQQALHQVLQPLFEPTFSERSYGFRPGRGAHQAVRRAQAYIRAGKRWVVDIDLEKFFDRVNHDVLMARVAREVSDARVLKLIRRFLQAGMMRRGWSSRAVRARRKAGRSRRYYPTSCSTIWTGSWRDASSRSAAMRMTATSTWAVAGGGAGDARDQGFPRGGLASASQH